MFTFNSQQYFKYFDYISVCSKNCPKNTLQTNFNDFRNKFGENKSNFRRSVRRARDQAYKQCARFLKLGESFSSTCYDNCMLCVLLLPSPGRRPVDGPVWQVVSWGVCWVNHPRGRRPWPVEWGMATGYGVSFSITVTHQMKKPVLQPAGGRTNVKGRTYTNIPGNMYVQKAWLIWAGRK